MLHIFTYAQSLFTLLQSNNFFFLSLIPTADKVAPKKQLYQKKPLHCYLYNGETSNKQNHKDHAEDIEITVNKMHCLLAPLL